jgi:hypothetical protein
MTVRYRSRRIDGVDLRERLRTLAKERRRFGYRRRLGARASPITGSRIYTVDQ